MGAGRDSEKGSGPPGETPLQPPPSYTEKAPLPPSSDPVVVPIGRSEAPVVTQPNRCNRERCQRRRGRCCCYCCTLLIVLIVCCTVLPIAIVAITKDMWSEPYVDIKFSGSHKDMRSRHFAPSETVLLRCEVEISTRYVPLVTWFHNPDRSLDNNGYRLIAVHDQIRDEMYKPRYEIVSKMSEDKITYEMIIRDLQPEDAGRYVCQVPESDRRLDRYQDGDSGSDSDSSDDDDDEHGGRDERRRGCFYRGRRSDYVSLGVRDIQF